MTIRLDEGAPRRAAHPFIERGHRVVQHAEVLTAGAPDEQVAAMAVALDAILVATDRDMRSIIKRFGQPNRNEKSPALNLVHLECAVTVYESRLQQAMQLIELEWSFRCMKQARRLWIDIQDHRITTHR